MLEINGLQCFYGDKICSCNRRNKPVKGNQAFFVRALWTQSPIIRKSTKKPHRNTGMYIHVYNIIDTKNPQNKMNFDSNLSVHLLKHA